MSVILGIDPGLRYTGYALLKSEHDHTSTMDYGYLSLRAKDSLGARIKEFHDFFLAKITMYNVTVIALETPFLGKNAQTFLKLGYLRGILYLLAQKHRCHVSEFSPQQVKRAVTGFGGASKHQVAAMIGRYFPKINAMNVQVKNDVTDAIAVSLCGVWSLKSNSETSFF